MIRSDLIEVLQSRHRGRSAARREIMRLAGEAQSASKRAIFALHRGDDSAAETLLLAAAEGISHARDAASGDASLLSEGTLRAALEEFCEARLYAAYSKQGAVGRMEGFEIDDDAYLGGLADLAGELQRRQVKAATEGDAAAVARLKGDIEEIVAALLALDLTGYLRTKADQARNALHRAEEVLYETRIRGR